MLTHLIASAALALAAADLLAAVVLLALLALGAPARRTTVTVLAVATVTTLAVGLVLASLGRPLLDLLTERIGTPPPAVAAGVPAALAVVLLAWAARRVGRGHPVARVPDALAALLTGGPPSTGTVLAVAAVVGLAPLGDLAFLAAVAAGAARPTAAQTLVGLVVFVLLAQAPSVVFGAAVLARREAAVARGRAWLTGETVDAARAGAPGRRSAAGRRTAPSDGASPAGRAITAAIALSGVAFAALAGSTLIDAAPPG